MNGLYMKRNTGLKWVKPYRANVPVYFNAFQYYTLNKWEHWKKISQMS